MLAHLLKKMVLKVLVATLKLHQKSVKQSRNALRKKNITAIVFDRGGYLYHGRVKALAEAARENGLEF